MDAKHEVARFLEELGRSMGSSLTLDHEGICLMENEDGVECEVSVLDGSGDFLLTSLVGEVGERDGKDFWVGLMSLNSDLGQTLGSTIGFDRDSGLLMLHQMHSVAGLDEEGFGNLIQDFYSLTTSLGELIHSRDLEPEAQSTAGAGDGDAAEPDERPWQRV